MSMNVEIRIDAPQALPTIAAVETGLGKVEAKGASATSSLAKGFGNSSSAAEKTKEATESLVDRMGRLAGVSKSFEIEGSVFGAFASRLGEVGTAFDGLVSKGAVEAAVLAGIAVEAVHLGDEYIRLSNSAQKLVTSYQDVDAVLSEQYELSKQLHGGLEETMELTTIVRERTADLGLSSQETANFTKELAAGVELGGKSMGEAAGLINRLSFALESGMPAGRMMKELMAEYPAIADDMTAATGKTAKQLIDLSNKGGLSLKELVGDIGGSTAALEKLSQRAETTGQQFGHFKDGLVLSAGKLVEDTGLTVAFGAAMKTTGQILDVGFTVLGEINKELHTLAGELGPVGTAAVAMGAAFALGLGPIAAVSAAVIGMVKIGDSIVESWNREKEIRIIANTQLIKANAEYKELMENASKEASAIDADFQSHNALADAIEREVTARKGAQTILDAADTKSIAMRKHVDELHVAVDGIMAQQDELKKRGVFQFGVTEESFRTQGMQSIIDESNRAQGELNDSQHQYGDLLNDIHKREAQRAHDIAGNNALLKEGAISQHTFNEEMKKFQGPQSDMAKLLEELNGPQIKFDRELDVMNHALMNGGISLDQYRDKLEKLIDALPKLGEHPRSIVQQLDYQINPDFSTPSAGPPLSAQQAKYRDYTDEVTKGQKDRQDQSLTKDWESSLAKYEEQAKATNQRIGETFKPVVDGLVGLFETGSINIESIGSKMEGVLTELAVKYALFKTITAFGGSAGTAAAIVGGSFANGGDVEIHAANGYSGRVGGAAGVDTKLFAAMVSPGEHISIRTPQQMADDQRARNPAPNVQIINQHDTRGELLEAFSSGAMDTHVVNVMKRNRRSVQSLMKK